MTYARPTGSAVSFVDTMPSRFLGWHYNTWTLIDLRQVAAVVRLVVQDDILKRDLYQLIVELKPEPSSLSLAEANAIQAIKDVRSISRASTSTNKGNVTSTQTIPVRKKRRSSARYRMTPRKRRLTHSVVDFSSDSEYIDSDDDDSGNTTLHSSPDTASYGGSSHSTFSSPSSILTRFSEVTIPDDGAQSPQYSLPAMPPGCTSIETCDVCSQRISHRNCLPRKPTANCTHDHNFICLSCLQQHITASASTQIWENIRCPHATCKAVLSFNDMQLFAPFELFARYDVHINRKGLEALSDYIPCANARCGSGGFVDFASDSFVKCSSCGIQTCVTCKTRYHPGLTHDENMEALKETEQDTERVQERLEEEAASQTFIDKCTKPCPNQECGVRIQKASGCNHMTCAQCGHEFCWLCLADYHAIRKHGNARHAKTCRLHSSRLK